MGESIKLKYVDIRPIYFPRLSFYPGGLTLPSKNDEGNIIKVTEKEKRHLMRRLNGNKPTFEEVNERQVLLEEEEE